MTLTTKRKYGLIPDKIDTNDFLFRKSRLSTGELPSSIDLKPLASPVLDQGDLGSCTAFALCALCEYIQNKDGVPFNPLSELFLYYNERVIENSVRRDDGAEIRDGIKSLKRQGVCHSKAWPYIISKFTKKPYASCYKEGLKHQILSYYRLKTLTDFKQCLADGYPFVGGIAIYDSFESDAVAQTGIVPYPARKEQLLGYHAISFFGYDDEKQWFICKNSWSSEWGDHGWFYLPYKFVTNSNLCDDLWTIRAEEN